MKNLLFGLVFFFPTFFQSALGFTLHHSVEDSLTANFESHKGTMICPLNGEAVLKRQGSGTFINTNSDEPKVHAIAKGSVVMVSTINTNGQSLYTVVIKHGKYYSAYSKLAKVSVAKGQNVVAGDSIGSLPDVEGVSCYFQLRKGSQALRMEEWIKCD